ncbi:MAG: alpha/beta hydrolase family protein [Ktedonobacteraceae bacterium]
MQNEKPLDVQPIASSKDEAPEDQLADSAKKTKLRFRHMLARVVLMLLFVIGFFFSVIPVGRAAARALYILPELILAEQPGVLSLAEDPIRHIQKTIPSSSGTVYLDIYEPTTPPPLVPGAREGVVVIPGVGDERTVPQLVNFSQGLARAGLVVMDVTTPTLIKYVLSYQDTDAVVQAFKTLASWPGVGARRIGIIGFSAGNALAAFAAADPRIREQVAFILCFGGYFNTTTLLRDFGRRSLEVNGHAQPWHPQYTPIDVLANDIAPLLPSYEGSRLVNALSPGGTPFTADELAYFSTDTVAIYHLLRGDEPAQADANIAALSPPIHALLDQLSPGRVIGQIRAPIYLLHDRNDEYVPFTQSIDFDAALNGMHHAHDFALFGIFQHVEVKSNLNLGQLLGDGLSLNRILNEVLQASV